MVLKRLRHSLFRPAGARRFSRFSPTACAVGCILPPLRGCLPAIAFHFSVSRQGSPGLRRQRLVGLGAAGAEKLPDLPFFPNHGEVEVGGQGLVFITARLRDDLAARIAEITLAVK